MSDLGEFLKQHVEKYLFEDIRSMIATTAKPGIDAGACGYPLVASAFAGIELLGGLLSAKKFDKHAGAEYFRDFWQAYLYPAGPKVADVVYQLVRHGLAHVYATKGDFTIVKGADPGVHLTSDLKSGTIHLDAERLGIDLIATYQTRVLPEIDSGSVTWAGMTSRHGEMVADYRVQAADLKNAPFPKGLPGLSVGRMGASGSHMPTSGVISVAMPSGLTTTPPFVVTSSPPFKP